MSTINTAQEPCLIELLTLCPRERWASSWLHWYIHPFQQNLVLITTDRTQEYWFLRLSGTLTMVIKLFGKSKRWMVYVLGSNWHSLPVSLWSGPSQLSGLEISKPGHITLIIVSPSRVNCWQGLPYAAVCSLSFVSPDKYYLQLRLTCEFWHYLVKSSKMWYLNHCLWSRIWSRFHYQHFQFPCRDQKSIAVMDQAPMLGGWEAQEINQAEAKAGTCWRIVPVEHWSGFIKS